MKHGSFDNRHNADSWLRDKTRAKGDLATASAVPKTAASDKMHGKPSKRRLDGKARGGKVPNITIHIHHHPIPAPVAAAMHQGMPPAPGMAPQMQPGAPMMPPGAMAPMQQGAMGPGMPPPMAPGAAGAPAHARGGRVDGEHKFPKYKFGSASGMGRLEEFNANKKRRKGHE